MHATSDPIFFQKMYQNNTLAPPFGVDGHPVFWEVSGSARSAVKRLGYPPTCERYLDFLVGHAVL